MNFINKILLFVFIVAIRDLFAQQTPCTAVPMTIGSSCSVTDITAPNPTNVWSVNGTGGMAAAGGLVNTCNTNSTSASGNYWMTVTVPSNVTTLRFGLSNPNGAGTESDAPEFQLYQLVSGTCGSNNLVFSYINCGGIGTLSSAVIPGATYYIRVYDDAADRDLSGENFSFCIFGSATNDLCANAIAITPGTPVLGNALGGVDINYVAGACNPDGGVWYSFTTPASPGCYSFAYQQTTGGCNQISIYQGGCPGTGTLLNANQSLNIYNGQGSSEPGFGGMLPNTIYYVNVANLTSAGQFTLNVRPNTPIATNDICSGAQQIGTTPLLTDNAVAGCEYSYIAAQDANISPTNVCATSLENVSWFSFTTQNTGTVQINFTNILCNNGGGGFQTGLFSGTCGSLNVGTSTTSASVASTALRLCATAASGNVTFNIPSSPAGTTYYIAMDGNAGSNCHFSVSGINIIPLPIQLINFDAKINSKRMVDIYWSTASEKNNDFFTIERSQNGEEFEEIQIIKGAVDTDVKNDYHVVDENPLNGTSYYRLKQTDIDGKVSYSSFASIDFYKSQKFDFKLFPNPSPEQSNPQLSFVGSADGKVFVTIRDISGKIMSEKDLALDADGKALVELNHSFNKGIYFVEAKDTQTGTKVHQKFIVN